MMLSQGYARPYNANVTARHFVKSALPRAVLRLSTPSVRPGTGSASHTLQCSVRNTACSAAVASDAYTETTGAQLNDSLLLKDAAKGLRAVVCGSGVAGLAAARVLADHFDEVLVLERDGQLLEDLEGGALAGGAPSPSVQLPEASEVVSSRRRGVPQWTQPHVMLTRGLQELDGLFPGLRAELNGGGAVGVATPRDWSIFDGRMGGELHHEYSVFEMLCCTRSLVETEIRLRLRRDCPNVRVVTGALVEGLAFGGGGKEGGADKDRVTGVVLRGGVTVVSDLVVDASGRGSRTPEWLQEAGWAPPPTVTVDSRLVYTSAVYQLPGGYDGPKAIMCYANPPGTRSGLLLPIEGDRHHLILAGRGDERCPPTDQAIAEFVGGLPHPVLADTLRSATRLGDIRCYERTANFRRKYEDIDLPGGLAVMGDSVCAFNPVYGQGMSVAVIEALSLGRELAAVLPPPAPSPPSAGSSDAQQRLEVARGALPSASRAFMRGIGEVVSMPWALATGTDAQFVPGFKRTAAETAINEIFMEVARLSQSDEKVHATLMRVMHMLEPPSALVAPQMLLKLLLNRAKKAFAWGGSA